jgi:hypothetical protein
VIIQCSIPVFEGLFRTEHNAQILSILFALNNWLSLAKLRLHTDTTLALLEDATKRLGKQLRDFTDNIAPEYPTTESKTERNRRDRRTAKAASSSNALAPMLNIAPVPPHALKKVTWNLNRIKFHMLGHYTETIRRFGTTDSYSTAPVCSQSLVIIARLLIVFRERQTIE